MYLEQLVHTAFSTGVPGLATDRESESNPGNPNNATVLVQRPLPVSRLSLFFYNELVVEAE